jgi:hypothetical protein
MPGRVQHNAMVGNRWRHRSVDSQTVGWRSLSPSTWCRYPSRGFVTWHPWFNQVSRNIGLVNYDFNSQGRSLIGISPWPHGKEANPYVLR